MEKIRDAIGGVDEVSGTYIAISLAVEVVGRVRKRSPSLERGKQNLEVSERQRPNNVAVSQDTTFTSRVSLSVDARTLE